ncbi:uncharacterized protein [Temnothorax nylanderi]|uniref:uncharacterized protein n=1 Tax=Temnothorax nylanderi TaxID=102681 RepID=UPI003A8BCE82
MGKPRDMLYFLDTQEAVHHRMNNKANQGCDPALMRDLSCFIIQCNEFAKTLKIMHQVEQDLNLRGTQAPNLMLCFRNDPQHNQRRYNAPRANEIAMVFQNVDGEFPFEKDIRIYNKKLNDVQQKTPQNPYGKWLSANFFENLICGSSQHVEQKC